MQALLGKHLQVRGLLDLVLAAPHEIFMEFFQKRGNAAGTVWENVPISKSNNCRCDEMARYSKFDQVHRIRPKKPSQGQRCCKRLVGHTTACELSKGVPHTRYPAKWHVGLNPPTCDLLGPLNSDDRPLLGQEDD